MACTLVFDEKIRQSAVLFWFGLRDAAVLYLGAVIQRTIDVSPKFLEHGSLEKIAACRWQTMVEQAGGLEAFLHKAAQKFKSIQIFKIKIKKSKTYSG